MYTELIRSTAAVQSVLPDVFAQSVGHGLRYGNSTGPHVGGSAAGPARGQRRTFGTAAHFVCRAISTAVDAAAVGTEARATNCSRQRVRPRHVTRTRGQQPPVARSISADSSRTECLPSPE